MCSVSNDELFSFCSNTLTNFEITFWTKTVKSRLFKNYLKRRKMHARFFWGSWSYAFQWEKTTENHRCVGAGARKVENLVRFLSKFDPYYNKKVQNIYWKYWKHGSNNAWKQRITLSFYLKGTLRPNDSVQVYDSVEWQKHLIWMSRGRKAKTTKGAESKLVLGAEFFFTTLSFDLVLTAHVFCVALHQSFGIELFHLR